MKKDVLEEKQFGDKDYSINELFERLENESKSAVKKSEPIQKKKQQVELKRNIIMVLIVLVSLTIGVAAALKGWNVLEFYSRKVVYKKYFMNLSADKLFFSGMAALYFLAIGIRVIRDSIHIKKINDSEDEIDFVKSYKSKIRYNLFCSIPRVILSIGIIGTLFQLSITLTKFDPINFKRAIFLTLIGAVYYTILWLFTSAYFEELRKIMDAKNLN
ncbi:MAG: hypothetical protein ACRC0F_08960 [Cetobacterium sp.]